MKSPIISIDSLVALTSRANHLILIDARSGEAGRKSYRQSHLDMALHVDLDDQLSDIKEDLADGGRHPLASIKEFAKLLGNLGITPQSHVVVYDNKSGANSAARFWWMMTAIGHQNIQVLDGGIQAAQRADYPMSSAIRNPKKVGVYPHLSWKLPTSNIEEVDRASQREDPLLIDVRATPRFNGEIEPIDPIAGHIPGAFNQPFSTNLDAEGKFKSSAELRHMYKELIEDRLADNIIVHCGSGVTACHTLLAMAHAGLSIPKLYVGSWSEWCRNNRDIAAQ